jgi:RNA polymerase sigma factor (TIGR02999 family)
MSTQTQATIPAAGDEDRPTAEERRALDDRFDHLYKEIRRLASRVRWAGANPTLNPTALVHEAYLKLRKDPPDLAAKSYDEVIGIFANAMHQILMDAARRKGAQKRVAVDSPEKTGLPIEDVITVAGALDELERENPRQAQLVRCRFLLGMTADETATALRLGKRTVEREWQEARARLGRKIDPFTE